MNIPSRVFYLLLSIVALIVVAATLLFTSRSRVEVQTFVTGLDQPRGMVFDEAGNLYVAQAGAIDAETNTSISPPTNHSSRVVRITPDKHISTILDGLPYTHYAVAGDIGASDVVLLDGVVYVLTGEGWDDRLARAVLRVRPDEPPQRVADLLSFAFSSTPATEQLALGGVPVNPYAMTLDTDNQSFLITDGASGSVLRVTLDGQIRLFAKLPNQPPLTGITIGPDRKVYFSLFSTLPVAREAGAIYVADENGGLSVAVDHLTMPIDIAFDAAGALYALEFSDGKDSTKPYGGDSGRVLRIEPDGKRTVVVDALNYPTAMAFSPSGDLFISINGAFSDASRGAIVHIVCGDLKDRKRCSP